MRVAMVSEHASPLSSIGDVDAGGQNVHVAALAGAIGRSGAEVVVHTRRDDPDLPDRVGFDRRVEVDHVAAGPPCRIPKDELLPHMGAFANALGRSWERSRPDVVHAHFWMSALASIAAARPLGIPVVVTFHAIGVVKARHQGSADTSPTTRLQEEEGIARAADHIIATSSEEVFELVRMGAARPALSVIPCGVDLSRFHPGVQPAPRTDAPRILVLSRMVPRKGVDDVIRALKSIPGAELVVAGGPEPPELDADPEIARLRRVAAERGVSKRVIFLGAVPRDDVPALMRSADVVVSVPWYEPFGIVPLEAMACGVPVVVAAVGGLVDTVVHGVSGIHVPPRRPERLAAALRALLANARRRAALGEAACARARSRYSWERVGAQTLEVYGRVIAEGAARSEAAATS